MTMHRPSGVAASLCALPVLAVAGMACKGRSTDGLPSSPGPVRVHITTAEGLFEGGLDAELKVSLRTSPSHVLALSGVNVKANEGWGFFALLTAEQARTGIAHLSVTSGVLSEGQSTIQHTGSSTFAASEGTCDVALAPGKVSGTATVTPSSLSASFSGDLVVSCWVPSSLLALPQPEAGAVYPINGGAEALYSDDLFVTDVCKPFQTWVP